MEAALEARAAMTDEEDELPMSADVSVDISAADTSMDSELKQVDTAGEEDEEDEDDEDMRLTEEEDDDDGGKRVGAAPAAASALAVAKKSPSKAKRKALPRTATDDEEEEEEEEEEEDDDDDDEMKGLDTGEEDDTADEDDEEPEEDDDEDEEDDEERKRGAGSAQDASPAASKIDLSDPKSMLRMVRSLPEREARRHEHFRRAHFDRGAIKRIMARTIQECASAGDKKAPTVAQVMTIVMAGMTKSFVGALTAEARRVMERNGETGPIEPRHLLEAQRKYYKRRPLARGRARQRLLR